MKGGEGGYTWDVANTARGSIAARTDTDAVYTAIEVGPNTVIVYDRRGPAARTCYLPGGRQAPHRPVDRQKLCSWRATLRSAARHTKGR